MNKQASLLAATSHAAEVSELKQRLERTENELGGFKVQLRENQGEERLTICSLKDKRCILTMVLGYVQKSRPRSRP